MTLNVRVVNDILLLDNKGIVCLDYKTGRMNKSLFKCSIGHEWEAKASGVIRRVGHPSTGCPFCASTASTTHEEVNNRLRDTGIKCIIYGGRIGGSGTFECVFGHHWTTRVNSVVSRKSGCPVCSGRALVTYEELNRRLVGRGIHCVEYSGTVHSKSLFKCSENHLWRAEANHVIGSESGCPVCADYGFNPSALAHLYYLKLQSRTHDLFKVGITNQDPLVRAKQMKAAASVILLDSLCVPEGRFIYPVEQSILLTHQHHISSEARNLMSNGYSECFTHAVLGIESGNTLLRVFQNYWRERDVLAFMRQQA